MNPRWESDRPLVQFRGGGAWAFPRAIIKGFILFAFTLICWILLLLVRLVEYPIWGQRRPFTPYIVQFVCRASLRILGIDFEIRGMPMDAHGIVVANHSSWLDIYVLNAPARVYFVAKSEIAKWPGIGILARAAGTLFIHRRGKDAKVQNDILQQRLSYGHKLLIFPEGTSTDGLCVLDFKPTLFEAVLRSDQNDLYVQPVTVRYIAPQDEDPRFYGLWGDMSFTPHFGHMLAAKAHGRVIVEHHAPLKVADFEDRKALARAAHAAVAGGFAALEALH